VADATFCPSSGQSNGAGKARRLLLGPMRKRPLTPSNGLSAPGVALAIMRNGEIAAVDTIPNVPKSSTDSRGALDFCFGRWDVPRVGGCQQALVRSGYRSSCECGCGRR
jgi:hypothetical protein